MPKTFHEDITIIKKHRFSRVLRNIFIVVLCVCCVVGAGFVSGVIKVNGGIKSQKFTNYYFLSMANFDTESDATQFANKLLKVNGAGFVYQMDSKYHVIGATYLNQKDAKSVADNMNGTEYDINIITISVPNIVVPNEYKNNTSVNRAIDEIKNSINKLYEYCVNLDKSTMSNIQVASLINERLASIRACAVELDSVDNSEFINKLKQVLTTTDTIMEAGMIKILQGNFSLGECKYTLCAVINNLKNS